jgi:hypothetical protein
MDVIIVCHTEFGEVVNKKVIFTRNTKGVSEGVRNLVYLANSFGAKVTFAVCPEVVKHFPKVINSEVGLHIHPGMKEYTKEGINYDVGDAVLYQCCRHSSKSTVLQDYSYAEQLGMIRFGKKYLNMQLGVDTTSFVGGMWSIDSDTVKALIECGFTHDCSAMAGHKAKHFDWSKLSRITLPYNPSPADYQEKGELSLLEVPISQMLKGGNVNPEMASVYGVNWLKLSFMEYYYRKIPLFHICLHSPCMTDNYFIDALSKLLWFIKGHKNISFKFASEIKKYG